MKSEDDVITIYNGTPITKTMLDEWDEAYSSGRIPDGYERDGGVHVGRPPLIEGDMSTITIRIPAEQKDALKREADERGMSLSGYVREVIALR